MKPEHAVASGQVMVPAVVSLAASSRRTLKHGDTFAMFDEFGDIVEAPRSPTGVFHFDTRFLSNLLFTLEGQRPLVLGSTVQPDNVTLDVDLTNPDLFDGERLVLAKDTFHVARAKFLWEATCYELFSLTSYADEHKRVRLALEFGADFADLFEIRGFPRSGRGTVSTEVRGAAEIAFVYRSLDGVPRATRLSFDTAPASLSERGAQFAFEMEPRTRRSLGVTVQCVHGSGAAPAASFHAAMGRARREIGRRRSALPKIETSNATVNSMLSRSGADLAMLMTDTPFGSYPYAGVPWYSAAFGRDGLITALETLWFDPEIARGVLHFLAAHQAKEEVAAADAEPGKILHERRECELARLGEIPFGRYYGSVDTTPLFVALAGFYWQRTQDRAMLAKLWPNVLAGLRWIERYGDRNGDGFVEYGRRRDTGLRNQGWKDSDDAVFHADGALAVPPIALCEVQGYVYLARRSAARMAVALGERDLAASLEARADALRNRFEAAFWREDLGSYALALDGENRPCDVRTSNAGQLLFTGICRASRAERVARQLLGEEFFSGWGIRTVGSGEKRFNPTSYHNGSVWPHDNALFALGLAAHGFADEALGLCTALFDAGCHMHLRRLPELFCGFERSRGKPPTLYPVACAPQAWAACAPFALLQACLGLEIDAASATVLLRRPRLPEFLDWLRVRDLAVGASRLDVLFQRQQGGMGVNLLRREGNAEVDVLL